MSRRVKRVFGVVVLVGVVVGVPATAYAASAKTLGFNISGSGDFPAGKRMPADVSSDFAMPARSGSGTFISDVYGCPSGLNKYNSALIRDVNNFPDQTIVLRNQRDYCAAQLNVGGLSWPSANYHFGVMPYNSGAASSSGIVGTRW